MADRDARISQLTREKKELQTRNLKAERSLKLKESKIQGAYRLIRLLEEHVRNLGDLVTKARIYDAELSSCLSVRVMCPSVHVSWTGLSSIQLALGLQEGKLGVTPAYVVDTSHSK